MTDTIAPVTTSDAVAAYMTPAVISLSATDDTGGSGVATTHYTLAGPLPGAGFYPGGPVLMIHTYTGPITVSAVGFYQLTFWSVDVAGNVEAPNTVLFLVVAAGLAGDAFSFNGLSNSAFGMRAEKIVRPITAEQSHVTTEIPGRRGALFHRTQTKPRMESFAVSFTGATLADAQSMKQALAAWLVTDSAVPLSTPDEPGLILWAKLSGATDLEQIATMRKGTITFECDDPDLQSATEDETDISSPAATSIVTTSKDGFVGNAGSVWATVRSAASGSSVNDNGNGEGENFVGAMDSTGTYQIIRMFLYHSLAGTTTPPLAARIDLAGATAYSVVDSLCLFAGTQAATLGYGDFDAFTGPELADRVAAPVAPGAIAIFMLNDAGIAYLASVGTGTAKFCVRLASDVDNVTPTDDLHLFAIASSESTAYTPPTLVLRFDSGTTATIQNPGGLASWPRFEMTLDTDATFVNVTHVETGEHITLGTPPSAGGDAPASPQTTQLNADCTTLVGWTTGSSCDDGVASGTMASDGHSLSPQFTGGSFGTETVTVPRHGWHGPVERVGLAQAAVDFLVDARFTLVDSGGSMGRIDFYLLDEDTARLGKVSVGDYWNGSRAVRFEAKGGSHTMFSGFVKNKAALLSMNPGRMTLQRVGNVWSCMVAIWDAKNKRWSNAIPATTWTDIAPQWKASTHYLVGTNVNYGGNGYTCATENTDSTWTVGHWTLVTTGSDIGTYTGHSLAAIDVHIGAYGVYSPITTMKVSNLWAYSLATDAPTVPVIVPAGKTLVIDCERSAITLDGDDAIMAQKSLDSTFFTLPPGPSTIQIDTNPGITVSGTAYLRERYL